MADAKLIFRSNNQKNLQKHKSIVAQFHAFAVTGLLRYPGSPAVRPKAPPRS